MGRVIDFNLEISLLYGKDVAGDNGGEIAMNIKLQLFIITISIISILLLAKRRALHLKYALVWLAVGSIILILTAFPGSLYSAADILNVEFTD
jgi:hypothetical protein